MFDGRGGAAGRGSSLDPGLIAGLATEMWTEENYVSKTFFNELFVIHKKTTTTVYDGDTVVSTTVDTSGTFAPNEIPSQEESTDEETGYRTVVVTEVDNIEAKKGLWTDFFLSALGLNGSGGGGGIGDVTWQALGDNTDTRQIASSHLTTALGSALAGYATQAWVTSQNYVTSSAISDMATKTWVNNQSFVNWTALGDTTTTQQIALSHLTTALSGYATQTWVTNNFSTPSSVAAQMQTYAKIQNGMITIGDTSLTPITSVTGTFWGKSFTNGGTVNGTIKAGSNGGAIEQFHSVEMNSAGTLAGYGGFIDFHYYATGSTFDSTLDYTSRIIESEVGVISILAKNNNATNANKLAGLAVGAGFDGSYIQIGDLRIVYDSTNNALKVVKLVSGSEVAANFYATGSVSALGYGSGGGGGTGDVTWTNLADNSDTRPIALSHLTGALAGYATTSQLAGYLPLTAGSTKALTGNLHINAYPEQYAEGIRIHVSNPTVSAQSSRWCGVIMCGSDNTGATGTSAKTWGIQNNDGNLYISKNGAPTFTTGIACVSDNWYILGGNVGIGTTSPTRKLHIVGQADNMEPTVFIDATRKSDNIFNYTMSLLMSALPNGYVNCISLGKAHSYYNSAFLSYHHVGEGSTSNYLDIHMFNVNNILNIVATGRVGIGTSTPSQKLSVDGNITTSTSDGTFLQIGDIRLTYVSAYNRLKIVGSDGTTAKNIHITGTTLVDGVVFGNSGYGLIVQGQNNVNFGQGIRVYSTSDNYSLISLQDSTTSNVLALVYNVSSHLRYFHIYEGGTSNKLDIPFKTGTIALVSDIPTNNNQLTNGAGYITSSGSCAHATSADSATSAGTATSAASLSTTYYYANVPISQTSSILQKPTFNQVYARGKSNDSYGKFWVIEDSQTTLLQGYLEACRNSYGNYIGIWNRNQSMGIWIGDVNSNAPVFAKNDGTDQYEMWHAGNDGTGSGLDADLLDGQHANYFAAASALSDYVTLATTQTISGAKTFTSNVTATNFIGALSGNASTATKLASAISLWGLSFDGSASINGPMLLNPVPPSGASGYSSGYYEGIRIIGSSTSWCGIFLGTANSYSGIQATSWTVSKSNVDTFVIYRGTQNADTNYFTITNTGIFKLRVPSSNGAAGLQVIASSGSTYGWNYTISSLIPSLSGARNAIQIGKASSAYNSGFIGFEHVTDGNNTNSLFLGHYGNDHIVTIRGNGNVGIGTTSPTYTLHVDGTLCTSGLASIGGNILSGNSGGAIEGFHSWELNTHNTAGTNIGGFLDFHYNGTAQDYSVRLIEKDYSGVLQILAKDTGTGNAQRAGLIVGAGTYTSFIQIGNGRIVWNDTDHALRIVDADGNACNLYATGGISALGYQSGGGGGGSTGVFSTSITPDTTGVYDLGTSTYKWRNLYLAGANGGNGFSIITSYSSYVYIGSLNKILFGADVEFEDTAYVENRMGIGVKNGNYDLYVYGENEGNAYFAGNVSVASLTNRSDMRLKDVVGDVNLSVQQIASAPTFKFRFKNNGKRIMVGTSAQYWDAVLPESITQDADGMLGLDYGVTALVSTIILAKGMTEHERRITKLEKENAELRARIKDLEEN